MSYTFRRWVGVVCRASAVTLAAVAWAGCAADEDSSGPRSGGGSSSAPAGGSAGAGSGTPSSQGTFGNSTADPSANPSTTTMVDPAAAMDDECPSVGRTTEPGLASVDIVWAIDGSGSMVDEAQRVQMNIQSFVDGISAAGVDTRVVFLAQDDLVPANSALAQGGNYLYLQDDVDSTNALDRIVARFPDYQSFLRPSAHVHFIVVTDDESDYMGIGTPAGRADAFQGAISGLMPNDYSVHAIASPGGELELPCAPESVDPAVVQCCRDYILGLFLALPAGCDVHVDNLGNPLVTPLTCPFLGGAARNGVTYYDLAGRTNGVGVSICKEDWTEVFASLRDAVIESAPLPCSYAIPEVPDGMFFDRNLVNVKYTPSGSDPMSVAPFPGVPDAESCNDAEAWYYDDPMSPTEIVLCPGACDAVGAATGGQMEIVFGCDTIPLE